MRRWRVESLREVMSLREGVSLWEVMRFAGCVLCEEGVRRWRVNYLARKISKKNWITQISLIFCEILGDFVEKRCDFGGKRR